MLKGDEDQVHPSWTGFDTFNLDLRKTLPSLYQKAPVNFEQSAYYRNRSMMIWKIFTWSDDLFYKILVLNNWSIVFRTLWKKSNEVHVDQKSKV